MITIVLLDIFRADKDNSKWFARDELIARLKIEMSVEDFDREFIIFIFSELDKLANRYGAFIDSGSDAVSELIDYLVPVLVRLGFVAERRDEKSGQIYWRIADSWPPSRPPSPPIRGDIDGGGNNNFGGGLREVLGHPVLFSLTHNNFNELVDNMFE